MFASWFEDAGLDRVLIAQWAAARSLRMRLRKISSVGGSLRDVQMLAGHSSLAVTQRYIEGDGAARAIKVVELV